MKRQIVISRATIDRLPLYYRTLRHIRDEGVDIVSSEEIGRKIDITPEQIRKDLASFGEFGKKGVGYYVEELIHNIGEILGLHHNWHVAIIGVGHLGWALANYKNFNSLGFTLSAVFETDSNKIGQTINEVEIQHVDKLQETVTERNIQIGIITVPTDHAQHVADQLVEAGIKGIWNFAPVKLDVPSNIFIINEDLSVGLSSLSYYLSSHLKDQ